MPPALRLTLVTLGVADVAKATAFYEQLGLVRSSTSNANVSFFDAGGTVLSLYGREALAQDAGQNPEGSGFRGQTLAWNLGSETDVDKAIVRMVAAGGSLVKAAEKTFWGGYSGYARDPDGHLWEVAHNPYFPLDEDGRAHLPD
ncbi:MAG: glyoxalase [Ancylobacter novellus]|uniref:Glyoxalase n=1 Tax=Ancylobacter novellus TaxID=921 RepID=A0A2W5KGP8_ANCNO|nr:MAG: glyoxalase [Ancylobacter novellus]